MAAWRGTWNAGAVYSTGDSVGYAGTIWVAAQANTGQLPSPGTYWTAQGSEYGSPSAIGDVVVTGTPTAGQVPTATSATAADWQTPSAGGTVTSVTATDASIVVSGTGTVAPTIATGTLDVIAAQHPPAASVAMNSQKLTSLANGSAAGDSAAFGQLPSSSSPLALASGGTGASAASKAALLATLGAAPLASPALTGTPTAVTAAAGDTSTQIATDAFVAQAAYQAMYANAIVDGFAAWTMDPWISAMSNGPTTAIWPSGVLTLNTFYLPCAITVNGYADFVWRGSTGFSGAYLGLYSLSGTTATLNGTGYTITSTAHVTLRGSLGLSTTTLAAGWWAFGFLVGTQGSTASGPLNANNEGNLGGTFTLGRGTYGRVMQVGTGLSALPTPQSITGFTESSYSLGWWAVD
jgi:hypothetical protein